MQTVSESWKNSHRRTILRESFVEISLGIADPDALADAESQDNGAIYISDSSLLTDGVDEAPTPYCTLEQNLWCLDGNRKAIPESKHGDNCYVSDAMSDDTCVFSGKLPTITINFSKEFKKLIPGITITWSTTYDEFADSFLVRAYQGDRIVAEKEVVDNKSVKTIIFTDIINYDRIVVIIKKWCLPNHRARVEEVYVGVNKTYGKADLFNYRHSQTADMTSLSLPKNEIEFSIGNVDGEYNPYNTEGLAKYLMERQEIKTRYGLRMDDGSIEWIKGGTFFLSEWYAKQNGMTAEFTARDLLEFMSGICHDEIYSKIDSGETTVLSRRTLYELAEMVLKQANLPLTSDGKPRWLIDKSLEDIFTTAPLPEDTLANCLQLIANAGRCVMYQDREGILHIKQISIDNMGTTDYGITPFNSYSKPEINLTKPIEKVIMKQYQYRIVEKVVDDKVTKVVESTTEDITTTTEGVVGETIIIDNPLVTNATVPMFVQSWVSVNLAKRITLDSSWRPDVRLDALDNVSIENAYNTHHVLMTDVEYSYNGAFRATGKGKVIGNG